MTRTVVAMEDGVLRDAVRAALERQGIVVRHVCRGGAEAIRAIKTMGGGVVICSFHLGDMSAGELAGFVGRSGSVLVIAKSALLELLEGENIFKLPLPVRAGELVGSVNVLLRLDDLRAAEKRPKRSAGEQAAVDRAKELLMTKNGYTEAAAHKYLQRRSMEDCVTMAVTASKIIASLEGTEK